MSFGADGPAAFRHGAKFVQRILQGKQPKDISPSISERQRQLASQFQKRFCSAQTYCLNERECHATCVAEYTLSGGKADFRFGFYNLRKSLSLS
jgi:hypothetical protein